MQIVKDLTPLLHQKHTDPRPWYEKNWPYMRHGQRVKIISSRENGKLLGKERVVHALAVKWIRRLSSTVNYDLSKKLFVFEELSRFDLTPGEAETYAKSHIYDQEGKDLKLLPIKFHNKLIKKGDYFFVCVDLFTSNWPCSSTSFVEDNIVHELVHLVRPEFGHFSKDGNLMEDEDLMRQTTSKLIGKYRQLKRPDLTALFQAKSSKGN